MRMFDSYEHQPSSCDMESIDEMPSSSQLSINDDLTISNKLNKTALSLRFKVS
jgi:hypothetical protein